MGYTRRSKNSSKIYANGKRFKTDSGGYVTVICQLDTGHINSDGINYYPCFLVAFDDGTEVVAWNSTLKSGLVRNPNDPNVYGVGVVGQGDWKSRTEDGELTPEYSVWSHMIRRCYSPNKLIEFPTYKYVSVVERWHYYQLFCVDIQNLHGYKEWCEYGAKAYHLDKDIKQQGVINKVYSPDTCMFVTCQENTTESNQRNNISGFTYLATRIADGYEELFYNQNEFARKYNLQASNIGHIVNKTQKRHTCKGWTFKIVAE